MRDYQEEAVCAYNDPTITELLWIIARRGGKTTIAFSECVVPTLVRETQTIVIVYPTAKMGFRNFWNNIENDGFKTLEHIPKELIRGGGNSEDDMRVELINGSVLMCVGATNVEALRGANGKVYWFDEFADMPIEAVNVVAPIIEANGGKMIFTGTPKIDGINGETMHRMHLSFAKDPTKYTCYVPATRYMTQEQLARSREGYITRNGNDFKYLQEMLLDWGQASSGSYYGEILSRMAANGKIGEYPYLNAYPVFTNWDIGRADNMAIIFWQYVKGQVRIIDSYTTNLLGLDSMVPVIKAKPYVYAWHFLPWDGTVHSTNDNVRRIDYMNKLGIYNISTLRREGITLGIDRVTRHLADAVINEPTCVDMIAKIKLYKRKHNPLTGDYIGAEHNSASHYADTLRGVWTALEQYWIDDKFVMDGNDAPEDAPLDLNEQELETNYYF